MPLNRGNEARVYGQKSSHCISKMSLGNPDRPENMASVLVADAAELSPDAVLILGGDRSYDKAAALMSGDVQYVLLPKSQPGRLERLGIYQPWETIGRRELTARAVPDDKILTINGEARNGWHRARLIDDWLRSHPETTVIVLADRFVVPRNATCSTTRLHRRSVDELPSRRSTTDATTRPTGGEARPVLRPSSDRVSASSTRGSVARNRIGSWTGTPIATKTRR